MNNSTVEISPAVLEYLQKLLEKNTSSVDVYDGSYKELTSAGIPKPRPAESIRSYDDFIKIRDFLWDKNKKDWLLWMLGVSLGLRASDTVLLKLKNLKNPDGTYREKIITHEKKTGKLQNCLITDSVKYAVDKYLETCKRSVGYDDYLFASKKTKDGVKVPIEPKSFWKTMRDTGRALDLPIHVGSHTMRKSFANISVCVDRSTVDMNDIEKVRGLLNHSSLSTTMRYLGTYQEMYNKARVAVSDFILGKTEVNELKVGGRHSLDDIFEKVEKLSLMMDGDDE